jgi:NitT/TauT family transport system substrate-binding protein
MRSLRTLRMQLNTFLSGPQAWFFLAQARGHLAAEGLALEFVEGDTAANTIPRMAADSSLDIGYGDLNALIEHVGRARPCAPMAIFASYNASPYTIAVPVESPVRRPMDLAGCRLVAHPNDAAWLLLREFCLSTGLDERGIKTEFASEPHSELVPRLLAGEWDGMFGFVNTLAAASIAAELDPARLRHLDYARWVPDLYGMAIVARENLVRDEPETLRGLLRALNRGLIDTVADPEAAIDALAEAHPMLHRASNLQRLLGTLQLEMAHAEGRHIGIGDLDDARLARGIALIARAKQLPHLPTVAQLFTRSLLPADTQRVRTLARPTATS